MSFEPQKFFIGLMDFFTILLPGAVLTYFLKDDLGESALGDRYCDLEGTKGWIAFLVASYLLGHFVFFLASLLDDIVYDPIRNGTQGSQVRKLASGKPRSWWFFRMLARCFKLSKRDDDAVNNVVTLKDRRLAPLGASDAINAFQWCKAQFVLKHRDAMAAVQRFEADSKFFRSLFVVMLAVMSWNIYKHDRSVWIFCAVLMFLALIRYIEQRTKATTQAYWFILTLQGNKKTPATQSHSGPTHAGGVVYRKTKKEIKYLFVQPTNRESKLVLPKGHINTSEEPRHAAVREVWEEAGVCGRIIKKLQPVSYLLDGEKVVVQFYLMEFSGRARTKEKRDPVWESYDDAFKSLHKETAEVLTNANKELAGLVGLP